MYLQYQKKDCLCITYGKHRQSGCKYIKKRLIAKMLAQ